MGTSKNPDLPYTYIAFDELPDENWAIAGKLLDEEKHATLNGYTCGRSVLFRAGLYSTRIIH